MYSSSQPHIGSLQLATLGVFIPQELANTIHPETHLLNIYQDITVCQGPD